MMTSYERLADAAFAAAMDVQLRIDGKATDLAEFGQFVRLLREPVNAESSYKLLQDPRNLPIYKEAWSSVYGGTKRGARTETVLSDISDLLQHFETDLSNMKKNEFEKMAEFCLFLNNAFLDENGRALNRAYNNRVHHASS